MHDETWAAAVRYAVDQGTGRDQHLVRQRRRQDPERGRRSRTRKPTTSRWWPRAPRDPWPPTVGRAARPSWLPVSRFSERTPPNRRSTACPGAVRMPQSKCRTAAPIRSKYPDLTAGQVINRLIKSASFRDHKGLTAPDEEDGYGIICPRRAVTIDVIVGGTVAVLGFAVAVWVVIRSRRGSGGGRVPGRLGLAQRVHGAPAHPPSRRRCSRLRAPARCQRSRCGRHVCPEPNPASAAGVARTAPTARSATRDHRPRSRQNLHMAVRPDHGTNWGKGCQRFVVTDPLGLLLAVLVVTEGDRVRAASCGGPCT